MSFPNTIIAEMQAEIAKLEQDNQKFRARMAWIEKERDELLDALTPFSKLYQDHHKNLPNTQPIYGIGDALIHVGDMRKAAILVWSIRKQ